MSWFGEEMMEMVRMMGGKTGAAMGAAIAMLFAGAAHAQSTVTLYGIVDAGVTYTNNAKGHSLWQFTGGNESGPRWGLIGSEDLGGGLKANFKLENGFNVANGALGQGGRMFGRSAWVGLSGTNWGAVTLGRQYNSTQDILGSLQMSSFLAQYSTHPFDNDDINNTFRTNNAVKYISPTIAGLQANLMYGFSNSTGFSNDNTWSAGVTYVNGPLNAGAAYTRVNHRRAARRAPSRRTIISRVGIGVRRRPVQRGAPADLGRGRQLRNRTGDAWPAGLWARISGRRQAARCASTTTKAACAT